MTSPAHVVDQTDLARQVAGNCLRADAAVAGRFALCGLLLRLRNLYKWEHGLEPWQEQDPGQVLEWVSTREEEWDAIEDLSPLPLLINGSEYDPFDTEAVNELIAGQGLIYGAGRVGGMLPVFFLGRLERRWQRHGLDVHLISDEFCPDLFFLPGLRQDSAVYLRRRPLGYLVWDLVADPRRSQQRYVSFGLNGYGVDYKKLIKSPSWEGLAPVLEGELDAVLWHEIGESTSGAEALALLRRTAVDHSGSELEHFVRGVKDLLADTGPQGRLAQMAANQSSGALGFYPAWLHGFPRLLLPEIDAAVMEFMHGGDWDVIEEVRRLGWNRARQAVEGLTEIIDKHKGQQAQDLAKKQIIGPLTGFRQLPDDS